MRPAPRARSDPDRRGRGPPFVAPARSAQTLRRPRRSAFALWPKAIRSGPICCFLAELDASASIASRTACPSPTCRRRTRVARAREHGMPPLDRGRFTADAALDATLERLLRAGRRHRHAGMRRAGARARHAPPMPRRATTMVRAVLADAIPVEALAEHVFVAAALQVHFARLAARLDAERAGPGRRRRLPGLRRPAGRLDGGRLAGRARHALLRLLAVRDAVALRAHQMHAVRLDQGHRLSGDRGRPGHGQGRDLRRLPRLREDPAAAARIRRSIRSPTMSRPSASICWCARAAIGAARSIRSCSAIESATMANADSQRLRKLPSVDEVLRAAAAALAIARFGRPAVVDAVRAGARRGARATARRAEPPDDVAAAALARLDARTHAQPAAGVQSHRHGAAHQSRPRAARRSSDRGRASRRCAPPSRSSSISATGKRGERDDHRARAAVRTDRRRGRDRRQQQRRRRAARAQHAGQGPRSDRLARRADRDRRRLPHARHHGARRRQAGRGRHHQPHAPEGLCRRDRPTDRADPQGAHLELPHRGLHQGGRRARTRGASRASATCRW